MNKVCSANAFQESWTLFKRPAKPPHPNPSTREGLIILMTLKQACSSEYQGAQGAFKDSMIHWILQFTLLIAFRCVLHRCESQEIRCWKLYILYRHNILLTYIGWKWSNIDLKGLQKVHRWRYKDDKACTCFPREPATTHQVYFNNDPSAGSPTETLLRLLLPLNDQVWSTSQQ